MENLDEILNYSNECNQDNKLYNIYTYLISAIMNKDRHGIMNHKAIKSLFIALQEPVLSIEVINT